MNILSGLRDEVATALAGTGANVYPYRPELLCAPALVILPGSPYVTGDGQPFGHHVANFTVVAVADVSVNDVATVALDDMIEAVFLALGAAGLPVAEAAEPYEIQYNTAQHMACDLSVPVPFTFN